MDAAKSLRLQGRNAEAVTLLEGRVASLRGAGGAPLATALNDLALARLATAEDAASVQGVVRLLDEAATLAEAAGDRSLVARVHGSKAVAHYKGGDLEGANAAHGKCIELRIGACNVAPHAPPAEPQEIHVAAATARVGGEEKGGGATAGVGRALGAGVAGNGAVKYDDYSEVFNQARLLVLRLRSDPVDHPGMKDDVAQLRAAVGTMPQEPNGARLVCELLEHISTGERRGRRGAWGQAPTAVGWGGGQESIVCVFAMVTCEWVVLFRACRSVRCLTTFSPRCVSLCLVSCLVVFTNALLPMPQPSTNHCIPPYPRIVE